MHSIVRSLPVLFLLLTAAAVPARAGAQDAFPVPAPLCGAPAGQLLAVPIGPDGEIQQGLDVVQAATGQRLGTIDAPVIELLTPLSAPGMALAQTEDGGMLLVDVGASTATPLTLPKVVSLVRELQPLPVGATLDATTVLTDGQRVFLLDLATAAVADLRTVLPEDQAEQLIFPNLSPDGAYLSVWAPETPQAWLIPLADPSAARPLGGEEGSIGSTFSPDGSLVVYSGFGEDFEDRSIVIERTDGSEPPQILLAGGATGGVLLDDAGTVVAERLLQIGGTRIGQIVRLSPDAAEPEVLFPHPIGPVTFLPAPDGTGVLIGIDEGDGTVYRFLDLTANRLTELPELTELSLQGPTGSPYRLASTPPGIPGPDGTAGYVALDLANAAATLLLDREQDGNTFPTFPTFSRDGRFAALAFFRDGTTVTYRVDLATGAAAAISEDNTTGGILSADGCWTLLAALDNRYGPGAVLVLDPDGNVVSTTRGTRMAVWLTP